ncbi:MAG: hypothetical protein CMF72_23910 [Mameliella sp.]|nr:hypothetical protein [Mameliella sp.]|tara:strand:- start:2268 stop:3686 length:1419 start_codon:yes stop_codon:yes gene_type:complete
MLRFIWMFVGFLAAAVFADTAEAARITAGKAGLCRVTLEGEITPGDVEKLRAAPMDRPIWWSNFEDGSWAALCLDSPGGSLASGLELARYVLDNRIGTVIDDGADCLSACALVFMFGTAHQHESVALTNRRLHVGGRLGFHQPDLTLDRSRDYSVDDVAAAFDLAIEATLNFLALAARPRPDTPRPFVDGDLLEAMLQHKGQDFFEIDTVNKAGRWDIALFGFTPPEFSAEGMVYACQNMTGWTARLEQEQLPYQPDGYSHRIDATQGQDGFADGQRFKVDFSGMMTYACEVGLRPVYQGGAQAVLCGYRENLSAQVGPDTCLQSTGAPGRWPVVPPAALLPAKTSLKDLKATRGTGETARVLSDTPCMSSTGRAQVINVQSFTSLRQVMSHDAPRLAELPLGSTYEISSAPDSDFRHPRHQACMALCQMAEMGTPYDSAALQSCIDTDWMWFQIKTPSGQNGYASARYLAY